MRLLRSVVIILSVVAGAGCDPDRREPCDGLYDHLTEIANRRVDPKLKRQFIDLCIETWDDKRFECLIVAQNPKEALSCRPAKVHPG